MRAAYGDEGRLVDARVRHEKVFGDSLPRDLVYNGFKNHGSFVVNRCRMGVVRLYVERMTGPNDLFEIIETGQKLVDVSIGALVSYAESQPEMQADPQRMARLRGFLSDDLRRDALNTLLMVWVGFVEIAGQINTEDADAISQREALRVGSFLVERGYLRPSELALLQSPDDVLAFAIARGVIRKIAVVLGHPEAGPLPPKLADLYSHPDKLGELFESARDAAGLSDEAIEKILEPLNLDIFGRGLSGKVIFRSPRKPHRTNGEWYGPASELRWEAAATTGPFVPQMMYAEWIEPDEAFQRRHFGKTVLRDRLADYVSWRMGLPSEQREKWDAAIDVLKPGADLASKLAAIRIDPISDPLIPDDFEQRADPASLPVEWIMEGLTEKE
ncbi:MAG: hypothetical protein IID33_17520 [Planctomycetes bacterium]|nr:hypothetical protein [Planctomycetota bacterium]